MAPEHYRYHKIYLLSTKLERISGAVKFFPHNSPIPQNMILEEFLEVANKLAKTLSSNKLLSLFNDKNEISEALKSLSEIFLRRLNALSDIKSQQLPSPTIALCLRVLSRVITTTALSVSTFSLSTKQIIFLPTSTAIPPDKLDITESLRANYARLWNIKYQIHSKIHKSFQPIVALTTPQPNFIEPDNYLANSANYDQSLAESVINADSLSLEYHFLIKGSNRLI